jgi:sugar phosphate isomerase/epimerase
MTTTEDSVYGRTRDYLKQLVDLCHELGGKVLVCGSPKQRNLLPGQTFAGAWQRAANLFHSVLDQAKKAGVTLCLEPLSPKETDFINTVAQGLEMVRQLNHPNFKIHLDVNAMCSESIPVADIIRSVPVADIGHVHVNDENLYGPGMGQIDYLPIIAALRDIGWDSWLSVEVFKFDPDGETIARKSIDYLKSLL